MTDDDMPRELTAEEVRSRFIDHVRAMIDYWEKEVGPSQTLRDRLSGVAFSILVAIDGCTDMPGFVLAPSPHPDDKADCIEHENNWYPETPEVPNDISGGLHELLYSNWS